MKKSIRKRIKITSTGKVLRRPMGLGHNNTKKTKKNLQNKKLNRGLNYPIERMLKA